jgi:hypothetical protein
VSIDKWQYSFIELFSILVKIYDTVEENGKRDNYKTEAVEISLDVVSTCQKDSAEL